MTVMTSFQMLVVAVVAVVLVMGLWNMMRGGSASRSQSLMRWRVGLQFAAIILLMATLWWSQRGA
jgi:Hypoxia induced protein conserved region